MTARMGRTPDVFAQTDYAPTEHEEQVQFVRIAELTLPRGLGRLLLAIANGGYRHPKTAKALKEEGVRAGVPDLLFACPRGGYHGLFIEMKRRRGGRVSDVQKEYIAALREQGYKVVVCKGCDEACEQLQRYLKGETE